MDVQHLIKISTGDTLEIATKDLLRLQQLLDEKKKKMTSDEIPDGGLKDTKNMVIDENAGDLTGKPPADPNQRLGFSVIGGINTVDQLTRKTTQRQYRCQCHLFPSSSGPQQYGHTYMEV